MDEGFLANRIFRSATFEGMADANGFPGVLYLNLYRELAENGVKNIITGCTYISPAGKMVQPGQAGIDTDEQIPCYKPVTNAVHEYESKIYLQISHAGRQTSSPVTGKQVVGASNKRSPYFMSKPRQLSNLEVEGVINDYANAAKRAKQAGFDGVQIHAAHGYLAHQFLHPYINNRHDEYGINSQTGIGDLFIRKLISAIRESCGASYPILVKVSAADDLPKPFTHANYLQLIRVLHNERVNAIEISYGTMENALNIFRGETIPVEAILKHNFRYKTDNPFRRMLLRKLFIPLMKRRMIPYAENYNLRYAELAKQHTDIPIICVGGFRDGSKIREALANSNTDFVSLCRPFLCEPDFINRICEETGYISKCVNCNLCAVMCDSRSPTRCYRK